MLPLPGDASNQAKPAIPPGLDAGNDVLRDHGAHWRDHKPCSGCEEAIGGGVTREVEAGEIDWIDPTPRGYLADSSTCFPKRRRISPSCSACGSSTINRLRRCWSSNFRSLSKLSPNC
jgi:hypothetical protein